MTPDEFVEFLGAVRATAILRTHTAEAAHSAMEAAVNGGFKVVECTLTTPGALDVIHAFSPREGIVVGAGTVMTADDALCAVEAGAKFLVAPVVDEAMIYEAHRLGVAVMPGTFTPTEMLRAHRAGAQLIKLFPAPGTGPKYVKSILGPMPFLKIVPTNGVHENNAAAYLKAGAFAVGFTTALFDAHEVQAGQFEKVEQRARKLLAAVGAASGSQPC